MVPDISNCIGSPEGYSDWILQAPSAASFDWVLTGFVYEDWTAPDLVAFRFSVAIPAATVAALDIWTNYGDYTVTINGITAEMCAPVYAPDGLDFLIGDYISTLGGIDYYRNRVQATIAADANNWYLCGWTDGIISYDLIRTTISAGICDLGAADPGYSDDPIRLIISKGGTPILDIEWSKWGSDVKPTSTTRCSYPPLASKYSGKSWTVTVRAGSVSLASGVTWITLVEA